MIHVCYNILLVPSVATPHCLYFFKIKGQELILGCHNFRLSPFILWYHPLGYLLHCHKNFSVVSKSTLTQTLIIYLLGTESLFKKSKQLYPALQNNYTLLYFNISSRDSLWYYWQHDLGMWSHIFAKYSTTLWWSSSKVNTIFTEYLFLHNSVFVDLSKISFQ